MKLAQVPNGSLFKYNKCIAFKSEYRTARGACECYILGSGEMFWGGTSTPEELNSLEVTVIKPWKIKKEDLQYA